MFIINKDHPESTYAQNSDLFTPSPFVRSRTLLTTPQAYVRFYLRHPPTLNGNA